MHNNSIAIQATQLGKCYHIYDRPKDRLKQAILRPNKPYYREFWALHDVSFTVHKGDSLGIIGRNGSGKSTLLQMLCQTLTPTTGQITVHGRIAALLELGAGFNPEFTGRENVFLNGTILGLTHHEMALLLDDILAFADIGKFIDQPVKTYSSGMFVRLAFAVQACIKPDILIIDEALSVGDIFFQQKCAKRMQQLREQGTTLIFVSHDMASVRDLCEQAIYLKQGQLILAGPSVDAIRHYFADAQADQPTVTSVTDTTAPATSTSVTTKIAAFQDTACWVNQEKDQAKDQTKKDAKLIAISIVDQNNMPTLKMHMGGKLKFRILYQTYTERPVHITLALRNRYDHIIHASGSYTNNVILPTLKSGDYGLFEMDISCMIEAGNYTFFAILGYALDSQNQGSAIDESPSLGPLTITWDYENEKAPWFGMFGLPTTTQVLTFNDGI